MTGISEDDLRLAIHGYIIGTINQTVSETAKDREKAEKLIEDLKRGKKEVVIQFKGTRKAAKKKNESD